MKSPVHAGNDLGGATRMTARLASVAGALILGAGPALASKAIIIGDSIGVGVSMAAGVPRLAHNSVAIRSSDALAQLKRAPRDTVAFISLGANDAVGSLAGVEKSVDKLVAAAKDAKLRAVWIGPPCVRKPWNKNVVKLDEILKNRLAGQIAYVSIADAGLCDKSLRASDGVHFNMHGYSVLWERAREAAGVEIEIGSPQSEKTMRRRADAQDAGPEDAEIVRASAASEPPQNNARAAGDSK